MPDDAARSRALYDVTAARTGRLVLRAYSTSFGLGTSLLPAGSRRDIGAVYALVRLADEVVDTYRGPAAARALDELESQVSRALTSGYSTNLVVHAFARAARNVGIGRAEVDPFFASMRVDLSVRRHDRASFDAYVYGSAEVVGVMCLRVFLNSDRPAGAPIVEPDGATLAGARALGAAFQKINFLRDLRADGDGLGRTYFPFPDAVPGRLDEAQVSAVLDEISADLASARRALPALPGRARAAVSVTLALYAELLRRLQACVPAELASRRVRVPGPAKALVVVRTLVRGVAG